MKIKNRKTGKEYDITTAAYNKLVERNLSRNYTVIDSGELPTNRIIVPKEIIEYQQKPTKLTINKKNAKTQ